MASPTLSIALATFNGEKYLPRQLKSLVQQRSPITELVVTDDGSSDTTVPLLREFAATAPFPVHVFQNSERLGYRVNFMHAAAACTGDLIAFCDQDDVWHPDNTNLVAHAFGDPEVMLVFHNADLIDERGRRKGKLFSQKDAKVYPPLSIKPWMIVPGVVQTLRRPLLRFTSLHPLSIDPYCPTEPMSHDLWYPFWASVLGKIAYIPDALVEYRQHGENTSGWPHASWLAYLHENIVNAEEYTAANVVNTGNRLELLEAARAVVELSELPRIETALRFYKELHALNERRLEIYRPGGIGRRAHTLTTLLREGAYARSLGYDALVLDAFIGLPTARIGRKA
ncbi:MAG TPA: glycosyltransferase [Burkholderiaceae bacterium]|nr:glycosyltransferase [Burkholderiaceae bacterium]